jgi:pimeloyl-[acyl-carrier protein] methyl ester esterase
VNPVHADQASGRATHAVHVETFGQGADVVLLHGWGLHGGVWSPLAESLATQHRVHVVDLPGHGHSRALPMNSLKDMAAAVAKATPAGAAVVGWSLGGQVALQLASAGHASRLALISSTPKFVEGDDWSAGMRASVLADFARRLQTDYRTTLNNFLALQVLHDSTARQTLKQLLPQLFARGEPHPDVLGAGLRVLETSDLRTAVASLNMPALIIHGDRDALTPVAAGRWLADTLSNAQYVELAGAAHAPFISHAELVRQALLDFLSAP